MNTILMLLSVALLFTAFGIGIEKIIGRYNREHEHWHLISPSDTVHANVLLSILDDCKWYRYRNDPRWVLMEDWAHSIRARSHGRHHKGE